MKFNKSGSSLGQPAAIGSKLIASLFFVVFFGMGLFFSVMLIREVVLKRAGLALLLFLLIPLVFVFIGGAGLYGTWFGKEKDKDRSPKTPSYIKGKRAANAGAAIGWLFVIVGLIVSYFLLVKPLYFVARATGWQETPCRIVSARVEEHDSDDGTTYSIDIVYAYEFEERAFQNDRYDFLGGSSSGREGKQKVVDRYRTMDRPVCYVDPEDPAESVLVRKLTLRYAVGLFPLVFVGAGAAVLIATRRRSAAGMPDWMPKPSQAVDRLADMGLPEPAEMSITLKPESTPLRKLMAALLFCLFWNGIVSVFIVNVVKSFQSGRPEWGLTLFMIPFVLVGLGTIGFVIYQLLAMFNPRYTLVMQPGRLVPGGSGRLHWEAKGMTGRLNDLGIQLIGTEKATYRRGTKTVTDESVFCTIDLVYTHDPMEIMAGNVEFAIPRQAMHSFNAANNKIIWSFKLEGDIERWPDVDQNYPVTIYPHTLLKVEI